MGTMLDCIRESAPALSLILKNFELAAEKPFVIFGDRIHTLREIILVGSGTSNTAAVTAKPLMEELTGVAVHTITANEFVNATFVFPEDALYVFTSQTGTSITTRQAQRTIREKGFLSLAVTESEDTPLAKESEAHLILGCGKEEYPMRTLGYCATVLVMELLGTELAFRRRSLDGERKKEIYEDAGKAVNQILSVVDQTMNWMETAKHNMLRADCIIFTGGGALYGVSLEGAMKVWETPQIPSFGYEIEEGIHGPNYGYNGRHCVIALNDGEPSEQKLLSLGRYMKEVFGSGFVIGSQVAGDGDLKLELKSRQFHMLEFAPVLQTIAYHLAIDYGRSMKLPHDNHRMEQYFVTHSEPV